MILIRKRPLFCAFLGLSLVSFAAGAALLLDARRARVQSELALERGLAGIRELRSAVPAPTAANLSAARTNAEALQRALKLAESGFASVPDSGGITDGVELLAAIQEHIAVYRRLFTMADPPVSVPADFAFGFDLYARESSPPADPFIPVVDRQRRTLADLLDRLAISGPERILLVQRERVEVPGDAEGFRIDPSASLRVPGIVDSLAFQIGFVGYTESLRRFLGALAVLERPVALRGLEVRRAGLPEAGAAMDGSGIFEADRGRVEGPERTVEPQPVIEENLSEFLLTFELVELTGSADTDANRND